MGKKVYSKDFSVLISMKYFQSIFFQFFQFLCHYKNEDSPFVWESIGNILRKMHSLVSNTDLKNEFKQFVLNMFCEIKKNVSWDDRSCEPFSITKMRDLILTCLVEFEDEETIEKAKNR